MSKLSLKNQNNQLPKTLRQKSKFTIQIDNSKDLSFYDSVHCLNNPFRKHKERPIKISPKDSIFNWNNVHFPTTIEDIKTFEKNNPKLLIYIWGYKEDSWYRFYMSDHYRENRFKLRTLQLLYYQNRYFPIINSQAFYKFYYKPTDRKKVFPCLACRIYFYYSQKELEKHCLHCGDINWEWEPETYLPSPETKIQFKNHSKTLPHSFVLYLDGESCLEKIEKKIGTSTTQTQHHKASTWGTLFVDYVKNVSEYSTFRSIENLFSYIKFKLEYISSLHLPLDKKSRDKLSLCSYCQKPPTKNNPLVEDHNHFSGESRGFIHNECNLQRKDTWFLPIVAHNMMGYDSYFLIRHLKSINNTKRVQKDDGVKIMRRKNKFIFG